MSQKLIRSAKKEWSPAPVELIGLKQISSTYGDMIVNAYVVWNEVSREAWIFDTGTDAKPIWHLLEEKLKVDAIFLTHTHRDHISCLDDLNVASGNLNPFMFTNLNYLMDANLFKRVLIIRLIHYLLLPNILTGILWEV